MCSRPRVAGLKCVAVFSFSVGNGRTGDGPREQAKAVIRLPMHRKCVSGSSSSSSLSVGLAKACSAASSQATTCSSTERGPWLRYILSYCTYVQARSHIWTHLRDKHSRRPHFYVSKRCAWKGGDSGGSGCDCGCDGGGFNGVSDGSCCPTESSHSSGCSTMISKGWEVYYLQGRRGVRRPIQDNSAKCFEGNLILDQFFRRPLIVRTKRIKESKLRQDDQGFEEKGFADAIWGSGSHPTVSSCAFVAHRREVSLLRPLHLAQVGPLGLLRLQPQRGRRGQRRLSAQERRFATPVRLSASSHLFGRLHRGWNP